MADLQTICQVVLNYARASSRFATPASPLDPIQPDLSGLSDDDFNGFFFELLRTLADTNLTASISIECLRDLAGRLYSGSIRHAPPKLRGFRDLPKNSTRKLTHCRTPF